MSSIAYYPANWIFLHHFRGLLGVCNNIGYVVMLSAAYVILEPKGVSYKHFYKDLQGEALLLLLTLLLKSFISLFINVWSSVWCTSTLIIDLWRAKSVNWLVIQILGSVCTSLQIRWTVKLSCTLASIDKLWVTELTDTGCLTF